MDADIAIQARQEEPEGENLEVPAPVPLREIPTPIREGHEGSGAEATAGPPGEPSDGVTSGQTRPRALKLVLTLKPGDRSNTIRVIIAVGADGRDPQLRSAVVENLQAALDLVPGFLAEAEARWQFQPRYPRVSPRADGKSASNRPKDISHPPRERPTPSGEGQQHDQQPSPSSPSSSQLSLFG